MRRRYWRNACAVWKVWAMITLCAFDAMAIGLVDDQAIAQLRDEG